eukprot:CAMPEP_0116847340 /NCGR_PEP_ID=MMETSP0418-20121206/14381_1 /TAXON_ID=1158023 /ORGANISM="Astrosyne radiata, Strain 13vi08-1A" /LENGTH=115 /DNA_ID=CAMNT_0004478777 /DNA_START=517 /DNA_END=864 /DNA_ORIENTATION=-
MIVLHGTSKNFATNHSHVFVGVQRKLLQNSVEFKHLCKPNNTPVTNAIPIQIKFCQRFVILESPCNSNYSIISNVIRPETQFTKDSWFVVRAVCSSIKSKTKKTQELNRSSVCGE